MNKINKPWGWEELLEKNDKYVVKKLFMKQGCQCSLQYHEYKQETIYVLSGTLRITLGHNGNYEEKLILETDQFATIQPNKVHRMYGETDCTYLECSTTELDDVVRLEDDYGRTNE